MTNSVEQECVQTQNAQSKWSIRFLRALRTKTGVRHIVAVRHHTRSQVSIPIDHIDSHVTLWHRDAEAALITSPLLHDVATYVFQPLEPGTTFSLDAN